jgi:hypothetical protein
VHYAFVVGLALVYVYVSSHDRSVDSGLQTRRGKLAYLCQQTSPASHPHQSGLCRRCCPGVRSCPPARKSSSLGRDGGGPRSRLSPRGFRRRLIRELHVGRMGVSEAVSLATATIIGGIVRKEYLQGINFPRWPMGWRMRRPLCSCGWTRIALSTVRVGDAMLMLMLMMRMVC